MDAELMKDVRRDVRAWPGGRRIDDYYEPDVFAPSTLAVLKEHWLGDTPGAVALFARAQTDQWTPADAQELLDLLADRIADDVSASGDMALLAEAFAEDKQAALLERALAERDETEKANLAGSKEAKRLATEEARHRANEEARRKAEASGRVGAAARYGNATRTLGDVSNLLQQMVNADAEKCRSLNGRIDEIAADSHWLRLQIAILRAERQCGGPDASDAEVMQELESRGGPKRTVQVVAMARDRLRKKGL